MKDIAKVYIIIVLIAVVFGFGMWIVNDVIPVLFTVIVITLTWLWGAITSPPVCWIILALIGLGVIREIIDTSVRSAIREREVEKATNEFYNS
jgi:hypothetical protein